MCYEQLGNVVNRKCGFFLSGYVWYLVQVNIVSNKSL